jgi:hypothetical protein
MKNFNHILILGLLTCLSCNKTDSDKSKGTTLVDKNIENQVPTFIEAENPISGREVVATERDTLIVPSDEKEYLTKIITTGQFHEDEIWDQVENENWLGLFKNDNQFYLDKADVKSKRVNDAIADNEDDMSGWQITTENKDTSILLVTKLDFLVKRKVNYLNLKKREIFPGDTIKFEFLGVEYELFAIGSKSETDGFVQYENYKLYLTADNKGKKVTQLLVAQSGFDDEMIDILFSGDIDGDNILDLIIDTSNHYNGKSPTLYLSRPANSGQILTIVGQHKTVGC